MLKEGYLPLSDVNFKFAFTESVNANWCTRAEIVSHFMKKAEYDILTQIKNDYCLKNYAIGYVEMKKKVNNINNQINQIIAERENEQREIEQAKRSQVYHNSTSRSGGRVCADCGGRGKETVWNGILRKYIDIRCRCCGGSGNAGYAGDYLENGRRVRSQRDQDLGRMMGVGGGGGIFGN